MIPTANLAAPNDIGHMPGAEPTGIKRHVDGTHRICTPAETLRRVMPMLPTLGITRISNVTGLDRIGIPVAMAYRPNARSISVSQGKGLTLEAAKTSAAMEALEVWHAERIVQALKFASFDDMRKEHRIADIDNLPRAARSPYTSQLPIMWIEGEDLMGGGSMWLPHELVSTNYTLPLPPGSGCFQSNTNGLASGNHRLEAICHGLYELVERDATTLWKLASPRARAGRVLDLLSVDDPACMTVLDKFSHAGIEARVWDTSTDLGLACFVCLLVDRVSEEYDPEFGAGCHASPAVALLRALTEAAQARVTTIAGARDDYPSDAYANRYRRRRLAFCEQLICTPGAGRRFSGTPRHESSTLEGDLRWILSRLRAGGVNQAIAIDLARESVGVPVVRMAVPGLEGLWDEGDGDYAMGNRARRASRSRP
jgi:ribosomal protein S12 methylthiotransferase accessory factor